MNNYNKESSQGDEKENPNSKYILDCIMLDDYAHIFCEPQPRPSPPKKQRNETVVLPLTVEQEVVTHVRIKVELMRPRLYVKRQKRILVLHIHRKSWYRFHFHASSRPMLNMRMKGQQKLPLLILALTRPRNERR